MVSTPMFGVLHAVVTLRDADYLHGDVVLGPVAAHTDVCEVAREAVMNTPAAKTASAMDDILKAVFPDLELSDVYLDLGLKPEPPCPVECIAHRWYELRDFDGAVLATWWPEDRCGPVPQWDVYSAELRQGLPGSGEGIGLLVSPALLERSRR